MISHRETRSVPYSAELMYAVVSDVEKFDVAASCGTSVAPGFGASMSSVITNSF